MDKKHLSALETDIDKAINNLSERYNDLENYAKIIKIATNKAMPIDDEYKKQFNHFYKVRRNSKWRENYYQLFEKVRKEADLSFEDILRSLCDLTGRVEASFASKMFATLIPDRPIWDSVVMSNLKLNPTWSKDKEKRLLNAVNRYCELEQWYNNLEEDVKQLYLKKFNEKFPEFHDFSATKKIDFILWQMRK